MNENFPPKAFAEPLYLHKQPDKPRPVPTPPEVIAKRVEFARVLGIKVESLGRAFSAMSEEERKAVFYKVTHEGSVSFDSTGLRPLVDKSDSVTLVVPRTENLDKFAEEIQKFAAEPVKSGMVKHADFARIEEFERGQPTDRLSDELFEKYDDLVKSDWLICEIELISLLQGHAKQREDIASMLEDLRAAFASGVHGTLFETDEGEGICRAVIRVTGKMFQQLVESDEWQRPISWFEPRPQFETFKTTWENFQFDKLKPIPSPPKNASVVCVVDTGVTAGNPFLEPVSKEDLFKSFLKEAPNNPYDENGHGSGVASLAAYHTLNLADGAENTPSAWIASARILTEDNQLEDERLFSKLLEEVVEHFAPLGVRIFNLSIGDIAKKWNHDNKRTQPRTSWTARTVDRLSREYDIVFVVPTGNIHFSDVRVFLEDGVPYPNYLVDGESRLLDPGQAALALTVGSVAGGTKVVGTADTAMALQHEPSPFSRTGPGFKQEHKPEVVEVGGNYVANIENWVGKNAGTNVVVASHKASPAVARDCGTSLAVPRVANKLAATLDELSRVEGIGHISASLLKAFLVNSASYRGNVNELERALGADDKKKLLDVLGYGFPQRDRLTECDDFSILLFHQGEINPNDIAFFSVPIPADLVDSTSQKRITVTTCHYPVVQRWGLESYLGVDLKWRMFRGDVSQDLIVGLLSKNEESDASESTDDVGMEGSPTAGDLEIKFEHKLNRRSRGTVQHDWFDWTFHKEEYSNDNYTLAISAYKRWDRKQEPIPYAVVVRIEDLGGTIPIYTRVSTQIDVLVTSEAKT